MAQAGIMYYGEDCTAFTLSSTIRSGRRLREPLLYRVLSAG